MALQRLDEPLDSTALEVVRRNAELLRAVPSAHLLRVREVVDDVLVLDLAAGGSLADLLGRRGRLSPGEVVTVVAPVAVALAAAHALGVVHGAVSPDSVQFSAQGMPLLSGLEGASLLTGPAGTAGGGTAVPGAAGDPPAAQDVWALAALCHHALTGAPPSPRHDGEHGSRTPLRVLAPEAPIGLVEAVEAVLSTSAERRPGAAAFASMLRRTCAATPVRLAGTRLAPATPAGKARTAPVSAARPSLPPTQAPGSARLGRHARRSRWPRQRLRRAGGRCQSRWPRQRLRRGGGRCRGAAVPLLVLVLCLPLLGWATGRGEPLAAPAVLPPASAGVRGGDQAASATATAADQWLAVLDRLDAAREEAFARGDPLLLGAAWAAGSPGLAADTAELQQLLANGETAHGVRHRVRTVELGATAPAGSAVRLAVIDELGEREIRSSAGPVRRLPGRGPLPWLVELVDTPSGWRLATVEARAPDPAASPS